MLLNHQVEEPTFIVLKGAPTSPLSSFEVAVLKSFFTRLEEEDIYNRLQLDFSGGSCNRFCQMGPPSFMCAPGVVRFELSCKPEQLVCWLKMNPDFDQR